MGEKGFAERLRLCDRLPDRTYLVQNKLRDFGVFFCCCCCLAIVVLKNRCFLF